MLILFNIIFVAFVAGIVLFIFQYRIKKKEHNKQLQYKDETHKKELLKTQMEIQTNTMTHIGQEIHDSVGQKLTLASLYLKQLPIADFDQLQGNSIQSINEIIDDSLEELREISKSLTNNNIQNNDIISLIEQLCARINNLNKCSINFEYNKKVYLDTNATKTVIFRIIQEFVQNSIKHSKCDLITINLDQNENNIVLSLKDNGIGFNINTSIEKGIGLKNFRKRAELIKAKLEYTSEIEKGTQLTLELVNYES
ncbi:sensor histidine kinase [Aquimarina sp. BL5]|nr:ATP-binding protein [Aquimarina sp. BL5]